LNGGIFLLSLLFFDFILIPTLRNIITYFMGESPLWNLIQTTLSWIFSFIWVVPLFVLSKIINTFWFQDIAGKSSRRCSESVFELTDFDPTDAAFNYRKGKPTLIPSISKLLADVVFSLLVQSLFLFQVSSIHLKSSFITNPFTLFQSMTMNFIPYIGSTLSFLHICLLYSLYSFEYKWFNQGLELHKRLTFIEYNWPYFMGFGFVLATLTFFCESFIINGCLFSMFFPLFIISGNESSPKQRM
jgi:etoposide-induced 2.4 mRNA